MGSVPSASWRPIPRWMSWHRLCTIAKQWTGSSICSRVRSRRQPLESWKLPLRNPVDVLFLSWEMGFMLRSHWEVQCRLWWILWVRRKPSGLRDARSCRFNRIPLPRRIHGKWIIRTSLWNNSLRRNPSANHWRKRLPNRIRVLHGNGITRIWKVVVSKSRR